MPAFFIRHVHALHRRPQHFEGVRQGGWKCGPRTFAALFDVKSSIGSVVWHGNRDSHVIGQRAWCEAKKWWRVRIPEFLPCGSQDESDTYRNTVWS
mmetsp:Transcript_68780/g.201436  ORF Transcript_68780/g.201436 Transcript_68780/m.201436 type:complete len:96 (+) Transcript_68780:1980-2267(+)